LPDDDQSGQQLGARFLTFKIYVLMAETKYNKAALKTKVNMTV
jgi:hypothetical protein